MNASELRAAQAGAGLRELARFWLDVVFPPVCARCGRAGWILCPNCSATLPQTPSAICDRCGRIDETADSLRQNSLCRECRAHPSPLVQMRAPLRYQEPTSTLIHRYKYEGYFALAGPLAQFLIAGWPVWKQPPDLILPIPLHPRRRRRRGYNQSELLARPLAQAMSIPVDASALRRTRHTPPQVGLGPAERHDNVRGAFAADAAVALGRNILLVDDVLTTGATMSAAAEALLAAGAASVAAYCLARVS